MAKSLWITYAWDDNLDQQVEYVAQEIESKGISVRIDRWKISAGRRLWEQIDKFISDPKESDAWAIYATKNSLSSEPCKEELAYAIDRALNSRGQQFPLIGIFPNSIKRELIPSAIRTRLYVSLEDGNWLERVISGVNGFTPNIQRQVLLPFTVKLVRPDGFLDMIEIAPRIEIWDTFFIGVPMQEKGSVDLMLFPGNKQGRPHTEIMGSSYGYPSKDGLWWVQRIDNNAANSNTAYFGQYKQRPSKIVFGTSTMSSTLDVDQFSKTGILIP